VGHSTTLLYGVLSGSHVNPYLVDAIIGLSVVYKALDNLGPTGVVRRSTQHQGGRADLRPVPRFRPGHQAADFDLPRDGLVANILAFNVGVEIGQVLALGTILIAMDFWRRHHAFARQAFASNVLLMAAGFTLVGYQLAGYAFNS